MRAAIITGAGSGIGRALARSLAAQGWALSLAGRREDALWETARRCTREGEAATTLVVPTDVGDPDAARHLVDKTMAAFGRVDALVNNAGQVVPAPIGQTDPPLLARLFRVNALGPGYLMTAVWPHFEGQGGGRIVNVSTMGTRDPFPGLAAYAAAKAATESFVRSAKNEGASFGVFAFAVAPGAVDTEMLRCVLDEATISTIDTLGCEEIAAVIVACLSGQLDHRNGETLCVPDRAAAASLLAEPARSAAGTPT